MRLRQHSCAGIIIAASFWIILIVAENRAPEWKSEADALTNDYKRSQIEGTELKLSCPAKGQPRPDVLWYKNNEAFNPNSDKIRVKGANIKFIQLVKEDRGNYTCVAQNSEGSIEFTYVVNVIEKIWPLVANVTSNITIYEGEDALFYCYVTNDKNARIQWLRIEAAEITGVRPQHTFLQSADESPEILILHDVRKADAGQYTCVIGNEFGSKYEHMYLTVLDPTTTTKRTTTTTTPTTTTTSTTTTTTMTTSTTTETTTEETTTDMEPVTEKKKKKKDKKKKKKDKKNKSKKNKNKKKDGVKEKDRDRNNYVDPYEDTEDTTDPYDNFDGFPYTDKEYDFGKKKTASDKKTNYNINTNWYEPTSSRDRDQFDPSYGYDSYVPPNNNKGDKDMNEENNFSSVSKNDTAKEVSAKSDGLSVWTVYIIVGSVAGGILLAGLVAIAIALCCQREEDPQYKSTSV